MELIGYGRCSTCKRAANYLDSLGVEYRFREVKEETPTVEEIKGWLEKYDVDIKRLFNTSGILYRELGLKDRLVEMSLEDKLKLLSSDGMLIKRPILVLDDTLLIGFKEKEWRQYFEGFDN